MDAICYNVINDYLISDVEKNKDLINEDFKSYDFNVDEGKFIKS